MSAPKRHQGQSRDSHEEAMDAYVEALEEALRDCVALAAGHVGAYKVSHDLPDYHPAHKEIINRAQRLLGGRELP
jgi:protoporphyrinogen oxidase